MQKKSTDRNLSVDFFVRSLEKEVVDFLLDAVHGVDLERVAVDELLDLLVGQPHGRYVAREAVGDGALLDDLADGQRAAACPAAGLRAEELLWGGLLDDAAPRRQGS